MTTTTARIITIVAAIANDGFSFGYYWLCIIGMVVMVAVAVVVVVRGHLAVHRATITTTITITIAGRIRVKTRATECKGLLWRQVQRLYVQLSLVSLQAKPTSWRAKWG